MNIIIIGGGIVGSTLSQMLSKLNHKVTIVESNIDRMEELDVLRDSDIVYGDGTSASTLVHAGVRDCDYLLAMTNDDRSNILACAVGSSLGAKKTLARVHDQVFADTTFLNYQLHFGIDQFVDPEALAAQELLKVIRSPERVTLETFAHGNIQIQHILVGQISNVVGREVIDFQSEKDILVAYIFRNNEFVPVTPGLKVEAFDKIAFVGHPNALFNIHELLNPEHTYKDCSIILMGGTELAINLIHLLDHPRFKINLIDQNKYRCQTLAKRFPRINVIQGDATSPELLQKNLDHADFFISCTKNDEANFMTALQAINIGCRGALTVISNPHYEAILSQFTDKIQKAVSPRNEVIKTVFSFISDENFIEHASLSENKVKLLEFKLAPNSLLAGKKINEISFPKNCILAILKHKFMAKIPQGDDKLLGGDHLIMICPNDAVENLKNYFA
jgi:trk system potassium uptake protein TrkA